MALKIKAAYKDHIIGFNNSSYPLGKRNDLDKLYQMAKSKNIQRWLDMFESIPEQRVLDAEKEKVFIEKQSLKQAIRDTR